MPNNSQSLVKDPILPSKAELFVEAYFEHNMNGTKAALLVFDIDTTDMEKAEVVAASMSYEYLRKPKVQAIIKGHCESKEINRAWLFKTYKDIATGKNKQVALASLDRLAHVLGIEIKPPPPQVNAGNLNQGTQVFLNVPGVDDSQDIKSKDVIDGQVAGGK